MLVTVPEAPFAATVTPYSGTELHLNFTPPQADGGSQVCMGMWACRCGAVRWFWGRWFWGGSATVLGCNGGPHSVHTHNPSSFAAHPDSCIPSAGSAGSAHRPAKQVTSYRVDWDDDNGVLEVQTLRTTTSTGPNEIQTFTTAATDIDEMQVGP